MEDGDGRTHRGGPFNLGSGAELISHQFSPDGDRLWTVVRRGQSAWLQSWKTSSGEAVAARFELGRGIASGDVQPRLRSAGHGRRDLEVPPRLWRTDPPGPIRRLTEHTRRVSSVAFNPKNGLTFVTGSLDRTCFVWNSSTGEPVRGPMRLPGQILRGGVQPERPDDRGGGSDGTAQFWDVERAIPLHALMRHPDAVSAVGFSPDGRWASTLSWDRVYLWDSATGEPLGGAIPHPKEVAGAVFDPAGRLILSRGRDFKVRIWETAAARPAGERLVHNGWVTAVAFRPPRGDSFLTAVGGSDGRVRSWETSRTGEPSRILENIGPILSLGYAPDGRKFATGLVRREVRLWDADATGPTPMPRSSWRTGCGPWPSALTGRPCSRGSSAGVPNSGTWPRVNHGSPRSNTSGRSTPWLTVRTAGRC